MQLPRCNAKRFSSAVRSPHSFVRKLSSTGDYVSPSKSHRCVVAPLWLRGAAACDERRMVASSSAWCAVQCGDRTALWHNSRARNAARSGTHRWLRPCAARPAPPRPAPRRAAHETRFTRMRVWVSALVCACGSCVSAVDLEYAWHAPAAEVKCALAAVQDKAHADQLQRTGQRLASSAAAPRD
jgi:hypothetical protein